MRVAPLALLLMFSFPGATFADSAERYSSPGGLDPVAAPFMVAQMTPSGAGGGMAGPGGRAGRGNMRQPMKGQRGMG